MFWVKGSLATWHNRRQYIQESPEHVDRFRMYGGGDRPPALEDFPRCCCHHSPRFSIMSQYSIGWYYCYFIETGGGWMSFFFSSWDHLRYVLLLKSKQGEEATGLC